MKKLTLKPQTIRHLTTDQFGVIAGGVTVKSSLLTECENCWPDPPIVVDRRR
jgi:hypothetical protein